MPEKNRGKVCINSIGLAEGIGFKPQIASARLGIPFIGTSSGNFALSAKLFKEYLDFLGLIYFELADTGKKLSLRIVCCKYHHNFGKVFLKQQNEMLLYGCHFQGFVNWLSKKIDKI